MLELALGFLALQLLVEGDEWTVMKGFMGPKGLNGPMKLEVEIGLLEGQLKASHFSCEKISPPLVFLCMPRNFHKKIGRFEKKCSLQHRFRLTKFPQPLIGS